MSYLRGPDRSQTQLLPPCLDDYVAPNAPARFIDAYVEGISFTDLGFTHAQPAATGRPPYHPADLLKLYLYGYLHRIRSSRRLEAEAARNLELIWLLRDLRPDFKTIADFRKDNRKAFKPIFKHFNLLAANSTSSGPNGWSRHAKAWKRRKEFCVRDDLPCGVSMLDLEP